MERTAPTDHVALAQRYVEDVLAGFVPAGKLVIAACRRHQADLERSRSKAWPFRFDPQLGGRACRFIEQLPHIKGPLAGQRIKLEPWQCFKTASIFGWVHKTTGKRRFRRVYIEVPRGNAKSTWGAGVALYCLAADGEGGAEVYSAATTRDQARIVWGVAQQMARRAPEFMARLGVGVLAHAITVESTASLFRAVSAEADTLDGLNVHLALIDELHAHRTRDVYDVLETGTGKRDQSLLLAITTAGADTSGICYEVRSDAVKVLDESASDDNFFALIYTIDEGDDWTAEATHRKANPNWGVSVRPDVIAQLCAKAQRTPAAQASFKQKHLDVWVNADMAWMDMGAWAKCADESLQIEDCAEFPAVIAVDLASRTDLASVAVVFRELRRVRNVTPGREAEYLEPAYYWAFWRHYLPEATLEEAPNAQYPGWAASGRIIVTEGDVIDFGRIEDDLVEICDDFKVMAIAFDPWQSTQLSQRLAAKVSSQTVLVEYRNVVATMSEPMKELGALVRQRRLLHDGDQVATWAASNVVCHTDAKENIFPRKERVANKIDPIVAAIMAIGTWSKQPAPRESIYNRRAREEAAAAALPPPPAAEEQAPPEPPQKKSRRRSVYDSDEWQEFAREKP